MKNDLKYRRIIGKSKTEIEGRIGTIVKAKKDGQITIVWDDNPGVKDSGYLIEEVNFVD